MFKYLLTILVVTAIGISAHADITITESGGISDAPSDGTQYARKDAGWEAVAASGGGGGSTARAIDVDSRHLTTANPPLMPALQDGSGDVRRYYGWDWTGERLKAIEVIIPEAGTYSPTFRFAAPFVTNSLTQTSVYILAYCDDVSVATSAVHDATAYDIDTFSTNGVLAVTASNLVLEAGTHYFDAALDGNGWTTGYSYTLGFEVDLGSAQ